MFDIKNKLDDVVENVQATAKTYYNIGLLKAVDKASKLGSLLVVTIIALFLFFACLIFVFFGFAHLIGEKMGDLKMGFFIMAGIIIILAVVILLLSKSILTPTIRNFIIEKINDDENDE